MAEAPVNMVQFDYIFPATCTQQDVFELVAQPVADRSYSCEWSGLID